VTAQVTHLLGQVFEAARLSLATAIQHAFVVGLGVSIAIVVITFFLKDVPLNTGGLAAPARQPAVVPAAGDAAAVGEAEVAGV
jgi:predicted membrane-bound mannosyltransferase